MPKRFRMMHKVCALVPSLVTPVNEKTVFRRIEQLHNTLGINTVVVYDQCWGPRPEEPWLKQIGRKTKPCGFVTPRNALLEWFYDSDFDYALLMDSTAGVSKPQQNAFLTLLSWLETEDCPYDVIKTVFQLWVSTEGILDHRRGNYDKTILVSTVEVPPKVRDGTLNGLFIANFAKKYSERPLIPEVCDPMKGLPEDVFLLNLLTRLYQTGLCSSLGVFKPNGPQLSTWRPSQKALYDYPPIKKDDLDAIIKDYVRVNQLKCRKTFMSKNVFEIPRVDQYKDLVREFKPRPTKKHSKGLLK